MIVFVPAELEALRSRPRVIPTEALWPDGIPAEAPRDPFTTEEIAEMVQWFIDEMRREAS